MRIKTKLKLILPTLALIVLLVLIINIGILLGTVFFHNWISLQNDLREQLINTCVEKQVSQIDSSQINSQLPEIYQACKDLANQAMVPHL